MRKDHHEGLMVIFYVLETVYNDSVDSQYPQNLYNGLIKSNYK